VRPFSATDAKVRFPRDESLKAAIEKRLARYGAPRLQTYGSGFVFFATFIVRALARGFGRTS
jgi:hypothetical protein